MTNLVSITSVISESVREEQEREPGHDCTDPAFVDRVAATHVGHTIEWMLANSPTLQELLRKGEIGVVGAMYDVTSGRVTFLESGAHGVDGRAPATGVETAAS
jgi:carbonic anhydrase